MPVVGERSTRRPQRSIPSVIQRPDDCSKSGLNLSGDIWARLPDLLPLPAGAYSTTTVKCSHIAGIMLRRGSPLRVATSARCQLKRSIAIASSLSAAGRNMRLS
jgi:hypothetical protein